MYLGKNKLKQLQIEKEIRKFQFQMMKIKNNN